MKTIGFIDYYIDEWHAHNYPRLIRESAMQNEFRLSLAWAQENPPAKMPLDEWCRRNEVRQADSVRQVVDDCDCLIVLSPDNPEKHEELADLALRSGKPTYIDKPIAPSLAAASRLFEKAAAHQTPVMSCSALRFAAALAEIANNRDAQRTFAAIRGGGAFDIYAIHQIEMLVMLLGRGATSVLREKKGGMDVLIVNYPDERRGMITLMQGHPFEFSVRAGEQTIVSGPLSDFFPRFIDGLLTFFLTQQPLVPQEQTLEIVSIVEAGSRAIAIANTWTDIVQPKLRSTAEGAR